MASITLDCPAKVNLGLKIIGRRADGYHLLDSVVIPIDWFDTLTLRYAPELCLHHSGATESLPDDNEKNLVMRAARLMLPYASVLSAGADIHLHKNIPSGAGLGGGSSNAAACLKALNRLWQCNLATAQLESLALKLGADVPFFIRQQPARMQGIGEQLTPVTIKAQHLLVLVPDIACDTAQVYAAHARLQQVGAKETKTQQMEATRLTTNKLGVICADLPLSGNDLTHAVCRVYPELAMLLEGLAARLPQSANWQFSGSGSALFCRCQSAEDASALASAMPAEIAGFSVPSRVVTMCNSECR